jgi:DNA-binding transcriptional ArsR family regulator
MSNEDSSERIDDVLELLANPLSRYILSVLAGVDPGEYVAPIDPLNDNGQDEEELDF